MPVANRLPLEEDTLQKNMTVRRSLPFFLQYR
jgi:hypothetical protein